VATLFQGDAMSDARKAGSRGLQSLIAAALLLALPLGLRAQQAGDLDPTFGVGGTVLTDLSGSNDEGRDAALQPDGKIVVSAITPLGDQGLVQFAVVRYLPDGSLDPGFGNGGVTLVSFGNVSALAHVAALQPDGGIIAAGYTTDGQGSRSFALARFLPDGSLDTTFSGDGKLTLDAGVGEVVDILVQPDTRIVAVGSGGVVRLHADGSLDTSFGANGVVVIDFQVDEAKLQPDGRIVMVGGFTDTTVFPPEFGFALARLLPDGSPDGTFGMAGRVNTSVGDGGLGAVALQEDGRILVAGHIDDDTGAHLALARYLPDGTLDAAFDGDGLVTTFGTDLRGGADIAIQPDGRIVVTGPGGLVRYLPDGSLDTTFSGDGIVNAVGGLALLLQPDGRLVVARSFSTTGGEGAFDIYLARHLGAAAPGVGPPTDKEQCKAGGWRTFTIPRAFVSQGDCIDFVNSGR
jgi:uncharacterized delta-60 repeat protein